jgi:hypothetical protein
MLWVIYILSKDVSDLMNNNDKYKKKQQQNEQKTLKNKIKISCSNASTISANLAREREV